MWVKYWSPPPACSIGLVHLPPVWGVWNSGHAFRSLASYSSSFTLCPFFNLIYTHPCPLVLLHILSIIACFGEIISLFTFSPTHSVSSSIHLFNLLSEGCLFHSLCFYQSALPSSFSAFLSVHLLPSLSLTHVFFLSRSVSLHRCLSCCLFFHEIKAL